MTKTYISFSTVPPRISKIEPILDSLVNQSVKPDKIFINVINKYPMLASKIFSSLARILNGDEMAKFMSGNASLLTTCKIIISMPKIPFIKSFFYVVYRKWFNLP